MRHLKGMTPSPDTGESISVYGLAQRWGCRDTKIYRLIKDGRIPATIVDVGRWRQWMVRMVDVQAIEQAGGVPARQRPLIAFGKPLA